MNEKILTLLGFAAKSGNLSYGMQSAKYSVLGKKAKLVLVSYEISEKSRKEMAFVCDKSAVKCVVLEEFDINTVSAAIGRKCGILSVNDNQFASAVLKTLYGGNANDK